MHSHPPSHERRIDYDDDSAEGPPRRDDNTVPHSPANHPQPRRSAALRRDLSTRNLTRAAAHPHELSPAASPSIVYRDHEGEHGNFFPPAYRRILANPQWSARLRKAYTASAHLPHARDRRRGELDCATSSDALLMSIFCHTPTLHAPRLRALLQLEGPCTPNFGVRTHVPLRDGLLDRTEADMQLGNLLVEAKLSEADFGTARPDLLARYTAFESTFDLDRLPRTGGRFRSYQLLRSVIAADHHICRFALFCDRRRPDLIEDWFAVLRAIRTADLRSRMLLLTWQEIAACLSRPLQLFLADKYGIEA